MIYTCNHPEMMFMSPTSQVQSSGVETSNLVPGSLPRCAVVEYLQVLPLRYSFGWSFKPMLLTSKEYLPETLSISHPERTARCGRTLQLHVHGTWIRLPPGLFSYGANWYTDYRWSINVIFQLFMDNLYRWLYWTRTWVRQQPAVTIKYNERSISWWLAFMRLYKTLLMVRNSFLQSIAMHLLHSVTHNMFQGRARVWCGCAFQIMSAADVLTFWLDK